jgi:hypothetical protein
MKYYDTPNAAVASVTLSGSNAFYVMMAGAF